MKIPLGERPLLNLVILIVLFFSVLAITTPVEPRIEVLRAVAFGMSAAVGVRYFGVGVESLLKRSEYLRPVGMLAVGIAILWIAEPAAHFWSYIWRVYDRPDWMIRSEVLAALVSAKIVAAFFHLLAPPGLIEGQIPPRNKFAVTAAIVAGVMVFIGMMMLGD